MKNITLIVLALLLMTGCGGHTTNEETHVSVSDSLKAVLDSAHGKLMDKMGDIASLKMKLQDQLNKGTKLADSVKGKLNDKIHLLDSANQAMFDFMHETPARVDSAEDSLKVYYHREIEKLDKVRDIMSKAIEDAGTALDGSK